MEVPDIPRKGVIIGIVMIILIAAGAYFLFIRNENDGEDGGGGNGGTNRSPVADAGRDISVIPGEIFYLNGSDSSDPDGDQLRFYWDMDIGTDTNGDGIFDNDRNREGSNISFSYPMTISETTEFIVTLNVTEDREDPLWDHSTVTVRVVVEEEPLPPPEVEMACAFVTPPFGLPGDPHFVLTVTSTTSDQFISNFSYELEDPDGNVIREGEVADLINISQNAEIRFLDTPQLTLLDGSTDSFTLRENQEIVEGCVFYLIYNDILSGKTESGYVELTK
jgi:hypothetical protein